MIAATSDPQFAAPASPLATSHHRKPNWPNSLRQIPLRKRTGIIAARRGSGPASRDRQCAGRRPHVRRAGARAGGTDGRGWAGARTDIRKSIWNIALRRYMGQSLAAAWVGPGFFPPRGPQGGRGGTGRSARPTNRRGGRHQVRILRVLFAGPFRRAEPAGGA